MRSLLCCASLLILTGVAHAAAPPRPVSFRDDVYPILSKHCLRCHQGSNPASAIRLDARSELLGESNGRPLVLLDDVGMSRLLAAVRGHYPDKIMPPPGRGKRLTDEQIDTLRAWISQGLAWDDKLLPPLPPPAHRFFRAVVRPQVPDIRDARVNSPIDAFLADGWRTNHLRPVAVASRRVLMRRLFLDLIGLPPSPEEIDAFERDARPDAYDRLVDSLLSSPRYGERWGRHWLDVARYADSEGYESNHARPHAWRYRDWVVRAFNHDLPYRDFIRLQLAGDEVRPYSDDNLIATGFLAAARLSSNEEDRARQRNDILVDVAKTTAQERVQLRRRTRRVSLSRRQADGVRRQEQTEAIERGVSGVRAVPMRPRRVSGLPAPPGVLPGEQARSVDKPERTRGIRGPAEGANES